MRLVSWNVNGLRAALRKGFTDILERDPPDVICLQETKLQAHQLPPELADRPGWRAWWSHAKRPGYSGVAVLSRREPLSVKEGFCGRYVDEGRTLVADFGDFLLFNGYFPNGGQGPDRLKYKLAYYADALQWVQERRAEGREVIITGDLNTAHMERDLARPQQNRNTSGFMDIEREWLSRLLEEGELADSFRLFVEEGGHYSWWSYRAGARARNIGWRLDYFLVTAGLLPGVRASTILNKVTGSDHCPVALELVG
jgi:exodeoxyribonuclease-3